MNMTHSVSKMCQDVFTTAIRKILPDAPIAEVTPCIKSQFGDYQCNSTMSLFSKYKNSGIHNIPKNPRTLGEMIIKEINEPIFSKMSIAGPGFINIFLDDKWIASQVESFSACDYSYQAEKKMKVVVDFSSPNICKEMHVGHLRSTILGETLCRLLEFLGHDVDRINHIGDWGTQFGMLIANMKDQFPSFFESSNENTLPNIGEMEQFYKAAKARFDKDEEFKIRAKLEVVKLQSGDKDTLRAWKLMVDATLQQFQKLYDRLDVQLINRGESFYNDLLESVVNELQEKELVKENEGAIVFFSKTMKQPLIVRKGDGGFGYDVTDLAAIRYRVQEQKADWLIYVTDSGQESHFKLLFEASRRAEWVNENIRLDHVGFGVVQGSDGKKFRTRTGETVKLTSLLDEAKNRALAELKNRRSEEKLDKNPGYIPLEEAGEVIGMSAVRYYDLSRNRLSNYVFSFDAMLRLDGDTGVYLMYAYARICSIISKSGVEITLLKGRIQINHPSERILCLQLIRFPEIIDLTLVDLYPNNITSFLYDLSVKFNDFYRDCRVIGTDYQESRLLICSSVAKCMRRIFGLLGMKVLERI